ncbi:MAG: LruC domain-containing protein [Bacteroidia bacterium]|nr:LruC domain-containing protein [Bacteroidia bacterium]
MLQKIILPLFLVLMLSSCVPDSMKPTPGSTDLEVDANFDFQTTQEVSLNMQFNDAQGNAFTKTPVKVWNGNPFKGADLIFKGFTDDEGNLKANLILPMRIEELVIDPDQMGLKRNVRIPIEGSSVSYTTSGFDDENENYEQEYNPDGSVKKRVAATNAASLSYMGTYNSSGVPNYLEPTRDVIGSDLLSFINSSLPEGFPVPTYHPRYLDNTNKINLDIDSTADVWITFVHEGAGWRNTVGFYTYPTNNPPQIEDDLNSLNVIFPNYSFQGGGGGLISGDKVYLGRHEAGTSIGFFLIANAWDGQSQSVGNGYYRIFSNKNLNPETDVTKQQHNVLLYDDVNELFLIGFEDINRESPSCDQDFNDAVFYVTANPITAVNTQNVAPIDKPGDSDSDGVSDVYDDFPNDPNLAYKNHYPSANTYGTLAFEDLWPNTGDYDFNDLVADYKFTYRLNPVNEIVSMEAEFVIQAIGAGFHNGFGFETNLAPSDIASVTGNLIQKNYINLNANGTESGQSKAVIIVTDDCYNSFAKNGGFVNTVAADPYITPDTIRVNIEFSGTKTYAQIGSAPYNPFLIINGTRGKEVHLPAYTPTDLADATLFGTGEDGTNISQSIYYKSPGNLPWGMNLPEKFVYPVEGEHISGAHLKFIPWVNSSGFSFMDWYQPQTDYRDENKLY